MSSCRIKSTVPPSWQLIKTLRDYRTQAASGISDREKVRECDRGREKERGREGERDRQRQSVCACAPSIKKANMKTYFNLANAMSLL